MYLCVVLCVFFFCQAEDVIRDLVRSCGLGDVYKRQQPPCYRADLGAGGRRRHLPRHGGAGAGGAVSYTHLTLPTRDPGEISVVAGSLIKKKKKR